MNDNLFSTCGPSNQKMFTYIKKSREAGEANLKNCSETSSYGTASTRSTAQSTFASEEGSDAPSFLDLSSRKSNRSNISNSGIAFGETSSFDFADGFDFRKEFTDRAFNHPKKAQSARNLGSSFDNFTDPPSRNSGLKSRNSGCSSSMDRRPKSLRAFDISPNLFDDVHSSTSGARDSIEIFGSTTEDGFGASSSSNPFTSRRSSVPQGDFDPFEEVGAISFGDDFFDVDSFRQKTLGSPLQDRPISMTTFDNVFEKKEHQKGARTKNVNPLHPGSSRERSCPPRAHSSGHAKFYQGNVDSNRKKAVSLRRVSSRDSLDEKGSSHRQKSRPGVQRARSLRGLPSRQLMPVNSETANRHSAKHCKEFGSRSLRASKESGSPSSRTRKRRPARRASMDSADVGEMLEDMVACMASGSTHSKSSTTRKSDRKGERSPPRRTRSSRGPSRRASMDISEIGRGKERSKTIDSKNSSHSKESRTRRSDRIGAKSPTRRARNNKSVSRRASMDSAAPGNGINGSDLLPRLVRSHTIVGSEVPQRRTVARTRSDRGPAHHPSSAGRLRRSRQESSDSQST